MSWFDKLVFWKKEDKTGPYKKVVAIRGEIVPSFLHVDIAEFGKDGNPTGAPGVHLALPIPNSFRATANRILCGQETPEDLQVLELHLKKHI